MKLGISDKYYYYYGSDNSTFEGRYVMSLKENLNFEYFNESLRESVDLYPEFKQKIIVKNNCLDHVKNDLYPVIFNNTNSHKYFTKEVNFYNYFFTYNDKTKELTLNMCHGLTDAHSTLKFCTCLFYHYALKLGDEFSDAEIKELKNKIRFSADETADINEELMFDPYSALFDGYKRPQFSYFCSDVYRLEHSKYDSDTDWMHLYDIQLKTSELIKTTKSLNASFSSFFIYSISKSICDNNVMDGKPIVTMLPVDFRGLCDIDTMVNFSDGIVIPFENSDFYAEREDVIQKIKENISKQITKENLSEIMAYKIKMISGLEKKLNDISLVFKTFKSILSTNNPKSSTYVFSNPGKIDFGRHLNKFFNDFKIHAYMDDCSCIICSYGEILHLMIGLKTDDKKLPESIDKELKKTGLTTNLIDHGKTYVNAMDVGNLEKIDN